MTVLEEVIMYTFQQCVYYISKVGTLREGSSSPRAPRASPAALAGSFRLMDAFLQAAVPRFWVAAQEKCGITSACFPAGEEVFGESSLGSGHCLARRPAPA